MSSMHRVCGLGMVFVLAACGGGSASNGNGNGSSNSKVLGGLGPACALSAGHYTQHYTPEAGGVLCFPLPDVHFTAGGDGSVSGGGVNGDPDTGLTCTPSKNEATCTFSNECTSSRNGLNIDDTTTLTVHGSSLTGTLTTKTAVNGAVVNDCTYDVTTTKN